MLLSTSRVYLGPKWTFIYLCNQILWQSACVGFKLNLAADGVESCNLASDFVGWAVVGRRNSGRTCWVLVDGLSGSSRFFACMLTLLPLHCCDSSGWPTDIMGHIKPALFAAFPRFDRSSIVQLQGMAAIFYVLFRDVLWGGPHPGVCIVRWDADMKIEWKKLTSTKHKLIGSFSAIDADFCNESTVGKSLDLRNTTQSTDLEL